MTCNAFISWWCATQSIFKDWQYSGWRSSSTSNTWHSTDPNGLTVHGTVDGKRYAETEQYFEGYTFTDVGSGMMPGPAGCSVSWPSTCKPWVDDDKCADYVPYGKVKAVQNYFYYTYQNSQPAHVNMQRRPANLLEAGTKGPGIVTTNDYLYLSSPVCLNYGD